MNHKLHQDSVREWNCLDCFAESQRHSFGELAFRDKVAAAAGENPENLDVVLKTRLHFHVRNMTSTGHALLNERWRDKQTAFNRAKEMLDITPNAVRSTHVQVDPCISERCKRIR